MKVNKSLAPEEQALLGNIKSLLDELMAGTQDSTTPPDDVSKNDQVTPDPNMAQKSCDTPDPADTKKAADASAGDKKEEPVDKSIETTPSDSSTASDDAEKRIQDGQTEMTEANVTEVAKALLAALSVKKSAPAAPVNPIVAAISDIVKVQKSQQETLAELASAFGALLEGTGVVDQMNIVQKSAAKTPVVGNDNAALVSALQSLLGTVQKSEDVSSPNSVIVNKSLSDRNVLAGLVGRK